MNFDLNFKYIFIQLFCLIYYILMQFENVSEFYINFFGILKITL